MKFKDLPLQAQEIASQLLAEKLNELGDIEARTEKTKEIAGTIREAFIKLYD